MVKNKLTDWRIGCSGFYYVEWKDQFYPSDMPRKEWFSYYCHHFNSIEINSSFYRMPSLKSLQKWYQESPKGFLFSMKAPRLASHYKQLKDCKSLIADFYAVLRQGLKEKLGAVLFQFPPSFAFSEENLRLVLQTMDTDYRNVVEFRNGGWWRLWPVEALRQKEIAFCGIDYPGTLPSEVIINTPVSYYRFHGNPVLYKSLYQEDVLMRVYKKVEEAQPERAFLFFNNTWGSAALINARQINDIIHMHEG